MIHDNNQERQISYDTSYSARLLRMSDEINAYCCPVFKKKSMQIHHMSEKINVCCYPFFNCHGFKILQLHIEKLEYFLSYLTKQ